MSSRTVLIFGKGQLSNWYHDTFVETGAVVTIADTDIRDLAAVQSAVSASHADLVINTAGKTNIDWCEKNREETFAVNVLGADNIARACQEANIQFLHVSSGCVQESISADDAHSETDVPNPVCFYAWTKVWGENLVMDRVTRHGLNGLILRPRQLLSGQLSPRNAMVKMLTYNKFIDVANSCTVIEDLMAVSLQLLEQKVTGLVNVTNPGITSPYQIASLLKEKIKPDMEINIISKADLNKMTFAQRIDTVLNTNRLESFGIKLRPINDRLPEIINQLAESLKATNASEVMTKTENETKAKLAMANS